ncbi:hypothetical protein RKD33_003317 [Streptomyces sp. SAI-129]
MSGTATDGPVTTKVISGPTTHAAASVARGLPVDTENHPCSDLYLCQAYVRTLA